MIHDVILLIRKIAVGALIFLIPLGVIAGLLWFFSH